MLLTSLLFLTSIVLSYLIYDKQNSTAQINNNLKNNTLNSNELNTNASTASLPKQEPLVEHQNPIVEHKVLPTHDTQNEENNFVAHPIKTKKIIQPDQPIAISTTQSTTSIDTQASDLESIKTNITNVVNRENKSIDIEEIVKVDEPDEPVKVADESKKIKTVKETKKDVEVAKVMDIKSNKIPASKPLEVVEPVLAKEQPKVLNKENSKDSFLQVTRSSLTDEERANIHLKKANQALAKGNTRLAAQEKNQALELKPNLHDIRTSLALYYYGVGEEQRATTVLKKGVLQFPEYADFSLMLARIAIKKGDQQKAYLYLNQHPPEVKGNLYYHVNYAILAQKFKRYAQSESLYQGLLSQRPDNGRWIMSLAIAQDKQGKKDLAVTHYQKALMKIDLSSKAKQYINQRLLYLKSQ